jgi:putative membrane-bound dehydrogenase-like protein
MRRSCSGFELIPALVLSLVFSAYAYQTSPVNRPWPPGVQRVSDDSPPLAPAEALKTFYMPPGYHVELVASEPLVKDPIAIDWDPDGRLWVVEYPEFVRHLQAPEPDLDPIGRIVVLEDLNGDGKMDKRTVFADGLVQARAVKVLDRGVLVAEPPNIWLMRDTNGHLKADTKELVATGFGRQGGNIEANANGFLWALDNWIHSAGQSADMLIRLKDGTFDRKATVSRGEWGATQDDGGRIYRNTNESALHVDLVPTPYYARNPNLRRTRGSYEQLTNDTSNINDVWPVRPNAGTNRAYQFGVDRSDGTLGQFTSACAPLVYRGDRLPAELYGNVFVAEPAANLVSRIIIEDDGTALRGRKAYPNAEFLASTDERFRPVFLSNAPDGTLFVVDMYRGVIEGRASITLYLRDYITKKKLDTPLERGRIYRVVHDTTRRAPAPALSKATRAQLVQVLSDPNGWRRDTAQRLLVERGAKPVAAALKLLAATAKEPRTRIHALWTLDGADAIDVPTVTRALEDRSRDVRVAAIRIAERWLGEANHPIQAAVIEHADDPDWAVRDQVAASLGTLPLGAREPAIAALLAKHGDDPVALDAALSGLRGVEFAVLERVLSAAGEPSPAREAAITMLTATIVQGAQDSMVQQVLALVGEEPRSAWQRSAVLRGVEIVLTGAPMPGSPPRGVALSSSSVAAATPGAPCATCRGGRSGPEGGYAFEDARPSAVPPPPPVTGIITARGQEGQRVSGSLLRLSREPAPFAALALRGGDLGLRAGNVLAHLEWPGKPSAVAPLPALTPEEQQRFDAGREIYKNICQSCHQPDGRGQDRVAPSLLGSTLALAPAAIPARILLNGKEGIVGLMPPLGMSITDDQVAAVLTYIRREWGQPGTPVDPPTIKAVRAETATRTRPWTNDELLALLPAGRF